MTTSSTMSLSSVTSLENKPIPAFEIGYLKATAQDGAYESFLAAFFKERERDPAITKAFIARRSGKSPEQVTRYLGSPGNWTIDTYAVLCAAIGYKPVFAVEKILDIRQGNASHPLISERGVDTLEGRRPDKVIGAAAEHAAVEPASYLHTTHEFPGQPTNLLDRTTSGADQASSFYRTAKGIEHKFTGNNHDFRLNTSLVPKNDIDPGGTLTSASYGFLAGIGA